MMNMWIYCNVNLKLCADNELKKTPHISPLRAVFLSCLEKRYREILRVCCITLMCVFSSVCAFVISLVLLANRALQLTRFVCWISGTIYVLLFSSYISVISRFWPALIGFNCKWLSSNILLIMERLSSISSSMLFFVFVWRLGIVGVIHSTSLGFSETCFSLVLVVWDIELTSFLFLLLVLSLVDLLRSCSSNGMTSTVGSLSRICALRFMMSSAVDGVSSNCG